LGKKPVKRRTNIKSRERAERLQEGGGAVSEDGKLERESKGGNERDVFEKKGGGVSERGEKR